MAVATLLMSCSGGARSHASTTGNPANATPNGHPGSNVSGAGGTTAHQPGSNDSRTPADGTGGSVASPGDHGDASVGASGDAGALPSAAQNPGTPPEVRRSWHEWPLPGKDYNNSRYTQNSSINSANVGDLAEAWRVELPGLVIAYGLASTVPIIADDTVYIEDLSSSVRAIELATGHVKWTAEGSDLNPGPNGVAVGWGKVFAIRGSDSVVAYDAATGMELWAKNVVDTATAGIDIQPTVFDGMVLVSTVPISTRGIYTGGDRGILKALDQETGEERWRFDTIASPNDVWGDSADNSGGGSWFPPSIDVETGRVFWGIANPAPFPGTADHPNATSRSGDNLYTDSTLVLDVHAGSYQWHHQTVQHDLFDRDLLHTMLTEVNGVPIVVSTGKEGRVWANRRDNGDVLWGPVAVGAHNNDELTELTGSTQVLPGSFGGVLTPPALADGVAYVAALNAPTTYVPDDTAYFGSETGTMNGSLVAIDVTTGDILWEKSVEGDPTGGATVINDLVITATFQGTLIAYKRATGDEVWRWTAPGGINSWPSVFGDTLIVPIGTASPSAVVIALRLGGGASNSGTGGTNGGSGDAGTGTGSSMFSSIYTDILSTKCAGTPCHSGTSTGGSFHVGADASKVRSTLIDRAASGSECKSSGMSLVVPGNPDMSLLYRKLTTKPPCGSRMPPTGALSAQDQERIRKWIADGAADD